MRKSSVVLVALGAFFIVLAPMVRWYAYPRIAVAPAAQKSVTTLVGPAATIFDITTLKEITTDLTTKVRTVGDTKAAERQGDGTVVYVNSTSTRSSDGVMRSRDVERMAFNQRTGQAVNCCGEFISNSQGIETPVRHSGLVAIFPIPTEKQTYQFWDSTLKDSRPIRYTGTGTVNGVDVFIFQNNLAPTKVGTQDVPLSLLGLQGSTNVTADTMYSVQRKLWVEPNTGVILRRSEKVLQTLNYGGEPRLTLTKVDTQYDAKTVKANADKYGPEGKMLHLVRSVLPWVSLALGLFLFFVGLAMARRPDDASGEPTRDLEDATV